MRPRALNLDAAFAENGQSAAKKKTKVQKLFTVLLYKTSQSSRSFTNFVLPRYEYREADSVDKCLMLTQGIRGPEFELLLTMPHSCVKTE